MKTSLRWKKNCKVVWWSNEIEFKKSEGLSHSKALHICLYPLILYSFYVALQWPWDKQLKYSTNSLYMYTVVCQERVFACIWLANKVPWWHCIALQQMLSQVEPFIDNHSNDCGGYVLSHSAVVFLNTSLKLKKDRKDRNKERKQKKTKSMTWSNEAKATETCSETQLLRVVTTSVSHWEIPQCRDPQHLPLL